MRPIVLTLAAALIATPLAAQDDGTVAAATAARIETLLALPKGARPLGEYARYYFRRDGKVVGYYLGADEGPPILLKPGVYLKAPPMEVDDGGCFVVEVIYDEAADRIEQAACNGEA